jgi:MbtH protein
MSTNPFDDENGTFLVLRNDEGQMSIWPDFLDVPAGWRVVQGAVSRPEALETVERTWTDMRPTSLVRALQGEEDEA